MNYYEVLGISQNSSQEEIKKAYRTLSLELHPDRNKDPTAEEKYKSINEAYETLSDVNEKQQYDFMLNNNNNINNLQNPFNMPEFNPFNMFHNLSTHSSGHPFHTGQPNVRIFTTHAPMNQFSGPIDIEQLFSALHCGMSTHIQKPVPIIQPLSITLEQVLTGDTIPVQIEKWSLDNGNKVYEIETVNVDIPKGINDNEVIILREKGNIINEHNIGDIKFTVSVKNHTTFKRSGLDLIYNHTITLKEALCGFKFELPYLNGKTYNINNTSGKVIFPGQIINIKSLGLTKNDSTGGLQIHFTIRFPESLTEPQISQLNTIL